MVYVCSNIFVMSELESAIKQAKVDKSHGTDKLINEFFINANSAMKEFLFKLFNEILSFENGQINRQKE